MRRMTLGRTMKWFAPAKFSILVSAMLGVVCCVLVPACADTQASGEPHVRVIKNEEPPAVTGGIAPDKQAEIQLVLQQRDTSTLKCYQDVLNDKHDRKFKGSVFVLLTIQPSGQASDVKVIGGSLNNPEVSQCLIDKIKEFEFPAVAQTGTMQYEYRFEPAY